MKKRFIALMLVVLMIGQMLPLNALADGWNMAVSNEVQGADYVNVKFQYPLYAEEQGQESISGYELIVEQMVKKGGTAVEPNIPDLVGREFTGWVNGEGSALDVKAPVNEDTVFTAAYRKLDIRTVTINYVFDVDGSMALEPYVAEFEVGSKVDMTITSPALSGFEPDKASVDVKIDALNDDREYEVRYKGAPTYYTVRYHFQNATDNGYTDDGFNRDAVHGHVVDDAIGQGETGWIDVGPYTISVYPEGAKIDGVDVGGQNVIAGGMTAVRDFEIEGFRQQDIVQRRVMPGGTTVVDVYYDREVCTYTVDNDGGTAVDSRTLRYGASLGLPDPDEMQRPGYVFDGFYSDNYKWDKDTQTWVKTEGEQKHDSTCKMPPYDFTIEVRWTPVNQAQYTVVYWVQSLSDKYDTADESKTYDFLDSATYTGAVGAKPQVRGVRPQDVELSSTFFELNTYWSEIGDVRQGGSWVSRYYYADADETIESDGSTVINVYFDRQTVTFEFGHYQRQGWNQVWVTDYIREGLYGQNWREAGYDTNGWPGGRWSDESGLGNGNWTYLDGFNHEDLTATSVRLARNTGTGSKDIYQYIEALDSTPENRKWIETDHYENGENNFNLSSKFLPGFTLYGYNTSTNNPTGSEITQAESGTSVSYDSRLNVFSTRNSFTLSYANCEGMDDDVYKYEAVLNEPVDSEGNPIVPQRPSDVEADNVFAGWYLDAAGQVPVDWGNVTMPAANMVVYAKWERPTFTVTYHDIRKDTAEGGIDTETTKVFEVEKFSSLDIAGGDEFDAFELEYVRDETTWKGNDRLEYIFRGWFLDENYTVRWEPATTISGDKDIYAYWEPKGKVYYRYVFIGVNGDAREELGKWPEVAFDETIWPNRVYGTVALASEDFISAGLDGFPEFEGWRPASTLSTTRERLTEQYQEIPVYYMPTSTWPITIHYVDENGDDILDEDGTPFTEEHDLTEAKKVYEYRRIPNYKLTSDAQVTADRDAERGTDGRLHLYFRYEKINPLPYTVEYYQEQLDGTYTLMPDETVEYDAEQSGLKLGETATLNQADIKTFTGFTRNDDHEDAQTSVILRKESSQNVIRLYYDRNSYTVTYIYGGTNTPENAPAVPAQQTHKYGAEVTVADKPTAAGYIFNGWYGFTTGTPVSGTFDMPAANIRLQGNWMADTDTAYQVWFYFERSDGGYPDDPLNKVERGGTTDTEVSATDADKQDMTIEGLLYRFDADNANNVLTGTIAADGSLVLKLYFERVTANYTVHHYLKGTQTSIAEDVTGSAQVGSRVSGSPATKFLYDDVSGVTANSATPANATITISEDATQNVVTIFYTLPLTLQADSASKTYDGKRLTEGGFTVVNEGNLMDFTKDDITLSMTADSYRTNPGTEPNEIESSSVKIDGSAVPGYYALNLLEGELTVYNRLNVSKTITNPATSVDGETGPALNVPEFNFTLTKGGAPVSGASYTVDGSNAATGSDGSFSLKQGETATFTDLEPGSYVVREVVSSTSSWYPQEDGSGNITRRSATIGTSGAGDIRVSFNNYRRSNGEITLSKVWIDGNGTAATRPSGLTLKLVGKVGDSEVYSADVTLTADGNWQRKVSNLPTYYNGSLITYSLVEENVPAGYGTPVYSADGLTVTNNVERHNFTITGTKTWVDGGRVHDNTTEVTLRLYRRTLQNKAWAEFNPGQSNFGWTDADTYQFTNLPSHDTNGYAYEYRVLETTNAQNVRYDVSYTGADGTPLTDGIAQFSSGTTATVNITNTVHDDNNVYVYGFKTWKDGGKQHDNAQELTITLQRKSAKPNSDWEDVTQYNDEGGFNFGWTEDRPNQYGFSALERYDAEGYNYEYRVIENINDTAAAALYEITYSTEGGVVGAIGGNRRVDITNALTDLSDLEIHGTKAWVDGNKSHNTADEVQLTLTRTSAKADSQPETIDAEPNWEGDKYTYSGLDRYDAEGYAYTYTVSEAAIEGYETTYGGTNGYDITNTIIDQNDMTVSGTKTWVDGGKEHDNAAEVTLTLTRKSAKDGAQSETVNATPAWNENTYTFSNLERYDAEGYAYTYTVSEAAIDGYTTAQDGYNFTNTLDDPNDVTVSGTKTWVDGGKEHDNAAEVTLTLTRKSAKEGAQSETVNATPVWNENTYTFSNLERYDAEGYAYTYTVSEAAIDGYNTSYSGENGYDITNTIIDPKDVEITGTKTWVDGGKEHNNKDEIDLTLYRVDPVTTAAVPELNATLTWEGDTYTFSGEIERYDDYGRQYMYKVAEQLKSAEDSARYATEYDPFDGRVMPALDDSGKMVGVVNITNSLNNPDSLTVSGTKTWLDGGRQHDNAGDITLKLYRKSAKGDAAEELVSSEPVWQGSTYTFSDLKLYDDGGYRYTYRVEESLSIADAALYSTSYTPAGGEVGFVTGDDGSMTGVVDITNALTDPKNVEITGTKTWVDGGKEHDNAAEVKLTLARKSAKEGAQSETVNATPAWSDSTYTFSNLERYDAEGYAYTYTVSEEPVDGYTTAQDGYNFTNTLDDPNDVTVSGTKTWVDGGKTHDNAAEVKLTLTRKSAKDGAQSETVNATPAWSDSTYTFSNLERYDAEGYAYTYTVSEEPVDGYTTAQDGYNFTNTLIEPPTPPTPAEGHITVTKQTVSAPQNEAGYALGETIRYLITVVNDGDFTITDIDVLDSLSDAEGKAIGRIDSLEPGQSHELNFEYTVTEADILRGKVVNEATVKGVSPDPDEPEVPVTPGKTEDDTEPKRGHITVTKQTVSTPKDAAGYALGETIEYLITVTNDGNLTITDIDVLDSLSDAEGKVIGHIDSLAPGQSHELKFEYTVKASDILRGKVVNEAAVSGTSPDPDTPDVPVTPGETEDVTEPERGHITVTKRTVSAPRNEAGYALGETIKYLITVVNDGNVAITDIDVLDSLSSASGHVIGSIERLEPGESREFGFEYTVRASDVLRGSVVNEATAAGASPNPDEPDVPVTPGMTEDETTTEREPEDDEPKDDEPKDDATFSIGAGYSAMNVFDCCE